jgi:glycosyltransferase involved in cell wall biosynthesis
MRVSVVVPARNAAATIGAAIRAIDAQEFDDSWEIVLVDDGSDDGTADLARAVGSQRLRVIEGAGEGAGAARNRGVAEATADLIAFTDSDCAPTRGWLAAGVAAMDGVDVVQGRVAPDPAATLGPFDRTLWVDSERGFYETANLFVRRELFERVGGFEEWLRIGGRPFAEDLWFGWRCVRAGARTRFVPEALVHHAVFPRGPAGFIEERRRLAYFPAVARRVPEFRTRMMYRRAFLSPRSAAFDAALAGAALAAARRSPLPLAAALPYARLAVRGTARFRRRAPLVVAVNVAADTVGALSLLQGSVRERAPVI